MSGKAATSELLMRALYLSGVNKESFGQSLTDSLDLALEEVEHAMLDPRVLDARAKGLSTTKPEQLTLPRNQGQIWMGVSQSRCPQCAHPKTTPGIQVLPSSATR